LNFPLIFCEGGKKLVTLQRIFETVINFDKMKRRILKCAAVAMLLMAGNNAQAQINLGSVLEKVGSAVSGSTSSSSSSESSSSSGGLLNSLTSIFSSKKQATEENLVGTWVYEEPAIVLSSSNILTNVAAKAASKKIQSKLANQLSKAGISAGKMSITLNSDKTFTETIGNKTSSGTWAVNDSKLVLTFSGIKSVSLTTQLSSSKLLLVTDASKLLSLMKGLANLSSNSTISTISTLMKGVDGMQCGLTMKKQ